MDSYAPCPCGSGKKVKFCCGPILPELEKIERLQDNNQLRMALQQIEKLLKDHPDNGWLVTRRAMILHSEERFAEARDGLLGFLRKSPDHPLANVLLAVVVVNLEPMEQCKKVVHRAFLKGLPEEPQAVSGLAQQTAIWHAANMRPMAARQHLAMA